MGDKSQIEWTDATWNPTRGCSKVSEGCRNCYAMRQAIRHSGPGGAYEGLVRSVPGKGPQWTGEVRLVEAALQLPLSWSEPRRVFVDSMSDLFHDAVPDAFIDRVFAVMACTPHHTYQILTKRPERAAAYLIRAADEWAVLAKWEHPIQRVIDRMINTQVMPENAGLWSWPLPNVWIGTSIENQAAADERIPHLLRAPAAVRFLSCEPLLGPLNLRQVQENIGPHSRIIFDALSTTTARSTPLRRGDQRPRIDWVIAGGESGPGARRCEVEWLRSLRNQCTSTGVPVFVKQLGARPIADGDDWIGRRLRHDVEGLSERYALKLVDKKGGDPAEWPEDLRVREFPL